MIDFADEIKNGAERRLQEAKRELPKIAGPWYPEICQLANQLYRAGYTEQAKQFVKLAYLHLRQKHIAWYTMVRRGYLNLLGGKYDH